MAQRKWITELADQLEGDVSTDKALLDIRRGVLQNLYHESIALYATATPKGVSYDGIKNLNGKDYRFIAEGKEDGVDPHTGAVDTIQIPINQIAYFALELPDTDLARMKHSGAIRAEIVGKSVKSGAVTMDCELFDVLTAVAAGKKGAKIEFKMPEEFDPAPPATPLASPETMLMVQEHARAGIPISYVPDEVIHLRRTCGCILLYAAACCSNVAAAGQRLDSRLG